MGYVVDSKSVNSGRRGRKFSDQTVNLIRNIYAHRCDLTGVQIAAIFKTSPPIISMIGRQKIYKDVIHNPLSKDEICRLIHELSK